MTRSGPGAVCSCLALWMLTAASTVSAGGVTRWFFGDSGDWHVEDNWAPAGVPEPTDTVVIPADSSVSLESPATVFAFFLVGTLRGTAPLTVVAFANWGGGQQLDFGATNTTGDLLVSGPVLLSERTLNNSGTAVLRDNGEIALGGFAAINNLHSGVFEIANDRGIAGTGTLNNSGTWRRTSSAGTAVIGAPFANSGALEVMTGFLRFTFGFTQIDGVTRLAGGTLEASPGQTINIHGGRLTGSGSVAAQLTNSGTVAPGAGIGTIAVDGDYTQMAAGRLAIEIAGAGAGEFDRLTIEQSFAANGALDVALIGDYTPQIGDRFEILTFRTRAGDFSARTGLVLGGGQGFNEIANPTSLVLEYAEEDCSDHVDNDGNGQVDCADFKCAGVLACVSASSPTPSDTAAPTTTNTVTPQPTATPLPVEGCVGDCDGDGDVSVTELIRGVNIALGLQPLSVCSVLDVNRSGRVEVNELIQAVNGALNGCV